MGCSLVLTSCCVYSGLTRHDDRLFLFRSPLFFPSRLSSPTPLLANLHPLPRPYKSLVGRMRNGSTDESMGALSLDLWYIHRRSYMFHNVVRHKCRNCRRLRVSSVHIPALLSAACHCVMLTIYALVVSFWLHSSGPAKASGVFFFCCKMV